MKNTTYRKIKEFLSDISMFFFGPFLYVIVAPFTGYEIFNTSNGIFKKKSVILLSAGSFFYFLAIIVYIYISQDNSNVPPMTNK
jgi:hypothetical protein